MKFCSVDEPVESKFPTVAREVTNELVKVPILAKRLVLVAFVVVELSAVKFCKVELPVANMFPDVRSDVMKPLVPFNDVAKRLVDVD